MSRDEFILKHLGDAGKVTDEEVARCRGWLGDYYDICTRHGMYLWGCGCCGSPSLAFAGEERFTGIDSVSDPTKEGGRK